MEIQSEQIDKIVEALAKAQGNIAVAVYDSVNPHFRNKYASYEAIRKACVEPLSSNGLSISHQLMLVEGSRVMVTQLSHISGQWMRSFLSMPQDKETPQSIGSSLTYAKRYSLATLLAIASDEDDDGEKAELVHRKTYDSEPVKPISKPADGVYTFPFGKHAGKPLNEVPRDYIEWLQNGGHLDKPQSAGLVEELKKAGLI